MIQARRIETGGQCVLEPDDDPVHLRGEYRRLDAERGEIERRLHEAEALIGALEDEVRLLTNAVVPHPQGVAEGIEPTASRIKLLVKARTTVRRALHPDVRPAADGSRATREFQEAEVLFNRLLARA